MAQVTQDSLSNAGWLKARNIAGWLGSLSLVSGCWGSFSPPAGSQILPDGTTNTQVDASFNIRGTTQIGGNLFHSFSTFGLKAGEVATFRVNAAAAVPVQNILGRVTGGAFSNINGILTIQDASNNPYNANLYLMNPAGIVFGPNSSVNIVGSFTATTANGIGFGSGGNLQWFSAAGGNNYALLTGNPTQVVFTMGNPGAIALGGALGDAFSLNQSITLIAGTLLSTGTIQASSETPAPGETRLITVPGPTRVQLSPPQQFLKPDLQPLGRATVPNPWNSGILSLPELVNQGGLSSATGLHLVDGAVVLTSTQNPIQAGDIALTQGVSGNSVRILAAGNSTVYTVESGNGGIEITVNGRLQATGTLDTKPYQAVIPAQNPALLAFLISKGIVFDPNKPVSVAYNNLPVSIWAKPDNAGLAPRALNAPIYLRFEGGTRTLINQTVEIGRTNTVGRVVVQGGLGQFTIGPTPSGPLVPTSTEPYFVNSGSGFETVTPTNFTPTDPAFNLDNSAFWLYFNQVFTAPFPPTGATLGQSLSRGAILQGVGKTNEALYGGGVNQGFGPLALPRESPDLRRPALKGSACLEAGPQVQDLPQRSQTPGAAGDPQRSTAGATSPQSRSEPCTSVVTDEEILKVLQ